MTAIALHLAEVLFNLPFLFYNSRVKLCCRSAALLATITILAWLRLLFIWPKNTQIRQGELSTWIISGTGEKKLLNFNIFLKILISKKPMVPCTLAVHIFDKQYKLLSGLSLSINCFFDDLFLLNQILTLFIQLSSNLRSLSILKISNKGFLIKYF